MSTEQSRCNGDLVVRRCFACPEVGSCPGAFREQQSVKAADEADVAGCAANSEQGPGDVRPGVPASVVADHQPLIGHRKDHLGRQHEARQSYRVHLRARDVPAPRASGCPLVSGDRQPGRVGGVDTSPSRSASSRAVPLGASGLPAEA